MAGALIILSGPSGVGKGTVRQFLMQDPSLNLVYSISMTTRKPRSHEEDGEDYFFVSKEEFLKHIENGDLLEYAQFVGNYYGTPLDYVNKLRSENKNVLLEIETNGALKVMKKLKDDPKLITIFLLPPSFEELENRIRGRKTESELVIEERLTKARKEVLLQDKYKYRVINVTPEQAAHDIGEIIKKY